MQINPFLLASVALAFVGLLLGFFLEPGKALATYAVLLFLGAFVALLTVHDAALGLLMIAAYALPIVGVSVIAGLGSGNMFRQKKFVVGALLIAPFPALLGIHAFQVSVAKEEMGAAAKFVEQNPQIIRLASGPLTIRPTLPSYSSKSLYEFDFPNKPNHHIVVAVSHDGNAARFRLVCVTTASPGLGHPCARGGIVKPPTP